MWQKRCLPTSTIQAKSRSENVLRLVPVSPFILREKIVEQFYSEMQPSRGSMRKLTRLFFTVKFFDALKFVETDFLPLQVCQMQSSSTT